MNEKIKQLAEQSYEAATITTIDPFTQEVVTDYIDGTKLIFNKEKFAELIVKECVEIADKSNQGSKSSNEGTEFYYNADIGDKIKEHFGVEDTTFWSQRK